MFDDVIISELKCTYSGTGSPTSVNVQITGGEANPYVCPISGSSATYTLKTASPTNGYTPGIHKAVASIDSSVFPDCANCSKSDNFVVGSGQAGGTPIQVPDLPPFAMILMIVIAMTAFYFFRVEEKK